MVTLKKTNIMAYITLMLVIVAFLVMAGCSNPPVPTPAQNPSATPNTPIVTPETATPVELNVSAAGSLIDVVKEINSLYVQGKPGITITQNFSSSGTLQTQIENGAPADIFISAAAAQMDNLQKGELILDDTRKDLLNNKVVLIVPTDSSLDITSFTDLTSEKVTKIAIGDPKFVPAGNYAKQAFDLLNITAKVQPKFVLGGDIRQVLSYVESSNVDAGIVFTTDAKTSTKVKVVTSAPDIINAKIVYPVAVIKASKSPDAARDYENFLFSTQAKVIFEKYGFIVVSK